MGLLFCAGSGGYAGLGKKPAGFCHRLFLGRTGWFLCSLGRSVPGSAGVCAGEMELRSGGQLVVRAAESVFLARGLLKALASLLLCPCKSVAGWEIVLAMVSTVGETDASRKREITRRPVGIPEASGRMREEPAGILLAGGRGFQR
jgi:hypothetical protein